MKIRIGVAGGTGYSGQELFKILKVHPHFEVTQKIGRDSDLDAVAKDVDLVFLCTPNEVSHAWAPLFLKGGVSVVDLSGAFRLKNHSYMEWYGFNHAESQALSQAEWGLYPYFRPRPKVEGEGPRIIANPGCFASAALLALIPLIKSDLIDLNALYIDAKSGTSGAGRKTELHLSFSERFGGLLPYRIGRHQHWPEIVELSQALAGIRINPVFVTELLPVERGISLSLFSEWREPGDAALKIQKLLEVYQNHYSESDGIYVGTDPALLEMKQVVGRNAVNICLTEAFGRPVVFCALDNLLRGAASQAVMNANQWAGLPVFTGLDFLS